MPRRLLHKRPLVFIATSGVVLGSFVLSAWSLQNRTSSVNQIIEQHDELIYQNCVANEVQDAVIVAQLEAAKHRARATLPKGSAELIYQMRVFNDGINALEPPDEPDCIPPRGTEP